MYRPELTEEDYLLQWKVTAKLPSSEAFLTGRGIHVWPRPDGFTIRVDSRGGKFLERDEMDAILSLGKIRQLEYEDTMKDIRIEVIKT
jgi:hypothetical protein